MKNYLLFSILLLFTGSFASAQEPNIFYSEPQEIKQFLEKKYKKIEIEIVRYRGSGSEKTRMPGKSAFRTIKFNDDNSCIIINTSKDEESDTTLYKYDNCGKLISKKGPLVNSKYSNRYKNCKLLSKESNQWEMSNGSDHQWNLIRYVYDKAGRLEKELIYAFDDSAIIKLSNEYSHKGNFIDSLKEFYYDEDGVKMLNRYTKYFYSSHLDSINYYSSESFLTDKMEYTYSAGKISSVKLGSIGSFQFIYNGNKDPEVISEESGVKDYLIKYFE